MMEVVLLCLVAVSALRCLHFSHLKEVLLKASMVTHRLCQMEIHLAIFSAHPGIQIVYLNMRSFSCLRVKKSLLPRL